MDWTTLLAGLGAVCSGAGGCVIVIHEFRRRDRREMKAELETVGGDLASARQDLITCRRYAFQLAEQLAEHGLEPLEPPKLESK